ncbi:PaaX family transcriptional regulator [Phytoactinopolyspora limicola]|uniref:PaaX family transcriptional regulator n=1 Tax=Phytoactinopolyspora limicola TaxID=2715536 RepID=UPI0014095B76|nr:PaaX family transcriptional regulator C-terminal domain-containing protein [Phytoactinopolyspora limicola]
MRARSIVFDVFGDYVRENGGRISLQKLAAVLGHFDVPPDSARVVMSRLAREGWFDVERDRRSSIYTPSERGWELLDSGLERIMQRPVEQSWRGTWYMVIFSVPEKDRAARVRLKAKLSWLGFGQLAPSTWVSPHDRLADAEAALAAVKSARFDLFAATSQGQRTDLERAAQCWDLDGLATDYQAFTARCTDILAAGPGALTGASAMTTRTKLVHEYRKFPFRDPQLPGELLPDDWPALAAYEAFLAAFSSLEDEAMSFYRDITEQRATAGV